MNKYTERLYNGIWKENPIFVQMLGLCPTLAVTTSAMNGLGMGLSSTVVLVAANFIISLMRSIIPGRVRLPGEIVVVASLVTIEWMGMHNDNTIHHMPLEQVKQLISKDAIAYDLRIRKALELLKETAGK